MQGYEFCACGTGMTDVSLPIFQVAVQKRWIQDDRRQGSFQLMAAAICFQLRAEEHWGPKPPILWPYSVGLAA